LSFACCCWPLAVGATAGGVLSSVGDAAKGLLGALLGPFEKEGAFDESTAALTGKVSAGTTCARFFFCFSDSTALVCQTMLSRTKFL
jgi:hypothetical protein